MASKEKGVISHTLNAWATEIGCDQQTIERKLIKAGYEKPAGGWGQVPFKKIFNALLGDDKAADRRVKDAQAAKIERENAVADKDLHVLADIERIVWAELLSPLREAWTAYPRTTGANLRAMLRSRGVADDVADDARKIAEDGVSEILKTIKAK